MAVGDDIRIWTVRRLSQGSFALRHAQAFGNGTTDLLRSMSVAVVGCSGTGSFVAEQLARLGIGRLVLVDPDIAGEKNLNRIQLQASNHGAKKKSANACAFGVPTPVMLSQPGAVFRPGSVPKETTAVVSTSVTMSHKALTKSRSDGVASASRAAEYGLVPCES
jgi:hypothetical protein